MSSEVNMDIIRPQQCENLLVGVFNVTHVEPGAGDENGDS